MEAKILLIEDEKNILETLKEVLELSDYQVFTATNGREGFTAIMEEKPDLVLCDVSMPEIDGFTLLKTINQKLDYAHRPVFLFLTARVDAMEIRKGMNLGADDYILKPFETSDVLDAIKLRLEKRQQMDAVKMESKSESKQSQNDKLSIPSGEGVRFEKFKNILYCSADRAYCNFHLIDKKSIMVSKPMKEFEEELLKHDFFKVHKSTIVNLQHIVKYERGAGGSLELSDGTKVGVSTRRKDDLLDLLTER
ncbi:MAG: response regulator [Vicingaceae bacterium]